MSIKAKIREIGHHSNLFGKGEYIGKEIEVIHLLPVFGERKTKLSNDHAIVKQPEMDDTEIITDVNLEITPV